MKTKVPIKCAGCRESDPTPTWTTMLGRRVHADSRCVDRAWRRMIRMLCAPRKEVAR